MAREHRREKDAQEQAKRDAALGSAGKASAPEPSGGSGSVGGAEALDENADTPKSFVHSYCALDYARAVDVASLRAHRLRRRLKEAVQKKCDPAVTHTRGSQELHVKATHMCGLRCKCVQRAEEAVQIKAQNSFA